MNGLTISFILAFFVCALFSGIFEGSGGINVTALSSDMSDNATVATVKSTEGFMPSDTVYMGNEQMSYAAITPTQFTGITRGVNGTDVAGHLSGARVYNPEASIINTTLGFNVSTTTATTGVFALPVFAFRFITITVPRLILWDFGYLKDGSMIYVRFLFLIISAGFVISLSLVVLPAVGGVLRSVLVR
ncbi:hypothetical protein LCGC14_0744930 [marine sediment metagenome]|uniref:Uncharacterized protein n=1 Tax=marine sediment metagenome TaxID=412755 RepID=A0A0F9Q5R1_9ZZZZ